MIRKAESLLIRPVESHWVLDEHLSLQLQRGSQPRKDVDELTVVGNAMFHVGVWPIGPPEHAIWVTLDHWSDDFHEIVEGRSRQ